MRSHSPIRPRIELRLDLLRQMTPQCTEAVDRTGNLRLSGGSCVMWLYLLVYNRSRLSTLTVLQTGRLSETSCSLSHHAAHHTTFLASRDTRSSNACSPLPHSPKYNNTPLVLQETQGRRTAALTPLNEMHFSPTSRITPASHAPFPFPLSCPAFPPEAPPGEPPASLAYSQSWHNASGELIVHTAAVPTVSQAFFPMLDCDCD